MTDCGCGCGGAKAAAKAAMTAEGTDAAEAANVYGGGAQWGDDVYGCSDSAVRDDVRGGDDKAQTRADYKACMDRQVTIPDSDPGALGKRSAQQNTCLTEANQKANARDQQRAAAAQQQAYQLDVARYNAQVAAQAPAASSGSSAVSSAAKTSAAMEVGAGLLATSEIWIPALIVITIIWVIVCVGIVLIAHWWWPGWSWEWSLAAGVVAFFAPPLILGSLGLLVYLAHRSSKKKKTA